jgi:hypothetical protein
VTTGLFLVARTLVRFASSRGWKDDEYTVYYRPESDLDRLHLLFVSRHFDDLDDYECTRAVWGYLENELRDEPELLRSLSLVVRSKKKVDQGGLYTIGPGYQRLWTVTPVASYGA